MLQPMGQLCNSESPVAPATSLQNGSETGQNPSHSTFPPSGGPECSRTGDLFSSQPLEPLAAVGVIGVEFKRFLVFLYGQVRLTLPGVGFSEAVVGVP